VNRRSTRALVAVGLLAASLTQVSACAAPVHHAPARSDNVVAGAVLLVRTPPHIQVALKSATALLNGEGVRVAAVDIVVCDEAVSALVQDQDLIGTLERARTHGVRTVACGLSLDRFGVDRAALPSFIDVVPNGIVETLRLQSTGFLSVEL
jgi:intracellular sulfur oxidation DsrE/DsrF family protein